MRHNTMRPHAAALSQAPDARGGLFRLARILQKGLLSPAMLQMRTLIAAEAQRFPDVAADYLTRSWARNLHLLADALGVLTVHGLLDRLEDPRSTRR